MLGNKEQKMSHKYADKFYIDETNDATGPVVRWNSNDQVPFNDMLEEFQKAGLVDSLVVANSNEARAQETRKFLENYRANYRGPSDEEKLEARAEFGAGTRVYNVITGTSYVV